MAHEWKIKVYKGNELLHVSRVDAAVELGRQAEGETPLQLIRRDGETAPWRLVVVAEEVPGVSRKHALVEPVGTNAVKLTNLTDKMVIRLRSGESLPGRAVREVPAPLEFALGPIALRFERVASTDTMLRMLEPVLQTANTAGTDSCAVRFPEALLDSDESDALIRWLQAAQEVIQSAATAEDFFDRAAHALVDLVDLDTGRVLLRDAGQWRVEAEAIRSEKSRLDMRQPSSTILDSLLREKKTCWQVPEDLDGGGSLIDVEALVAAPLIDARGEVVGALYGDRARRPDSGSSSTLSRMEARLVELLAGGLSAGLARVNTEREALKSRMQFELFFGPELSRHLAAEPDLLVARDQDITVLFCDVQGFSRVSERHGPAVTLDWMGDVLDTLSRCVLNEGGVVVDYIGDEIFAMFGAPHGCDDHADAACRAGVAMLEVLREINARWASRIGTLTNIGVGINTGVARIGNTGSRTRFKYGALGHTVNLASRVLGANKFLKTQALMTEATRSALTAAHATRRLCQVEVVNIHQPVGLHELISGKTSGWHKLKHGYEAALAAFEEGQARKAVRLLGNLLEETPEDGPSMRLLARAVEAMTDPGSSRMVWVLPGK